MIYDPTQIILNVTVREILYEVPTDEEIDSVAKFGVTEQESCV